ncbi:MAG: glycine oxidase ThiO [Planctomycetia bacterium]|nr:glycine oxidase ThiO [Planctomycetia bacterium]
MKVNDVCIVGGGVIGLTLAYLLAKEQVKVTLIDKGDLGQEASWAGAGILPAGNPRRAKSAMGKLRAQAVSFFPDFSRELLELTGIDNGYWQCGGLELRSNADELEKKRLQQLAQIEKGEGLSCEVLSHKQLHQLEPELAGVLPGAVYFPGVAQIRNPRHLKALVAACEIRQVHFERFTPALSMKLDKERITGVQTSNGLIPADKVVIAAGTWTTGILAELQWKPALKPVKGQIVLLNTNQMHEQTQPILRHILLMGHRYLVPRGDGRILVGASEEDVGFDKTPTDDVGHALHSLATQTIPALSHANIEHHWAGLRPCSTDGRPYLGQVPGYQGLYVAAGHFRSGLQLSIMTGILMRDMLLGQPSIQDITPYRPDRPVTQPIPWIAHAQ